MIHVGDIVIVTCDHPSGASGVNVKGDMGVVTESFEDSEGVYTLKVGDFLYIEPELRLATVIEKEVKLIDLLLLNH